MRSRPRVATVDVITDAAALADVEPAWRRLAEARGNAFVSPEWFRAWRKRQAEETVPWVVVVRDGDAIRGLLPLLSYARARVRLLRFAGGGFGDFFHPASAREDEEAVALAAGQTLAERRQEWTALILDNVDLAAPWVETLRNCSARPLAATEVHREALPFIDLSGISSWDGYVDTRSRKLRAQLRRGLRVLERDHAVRLRSASHAEELGLDLSVFFDLHHRRRGTVGGSTLSRPGARDALLDFAAAALNAGWLRLWFLDVDEQPIAAWYGWRIGQRYAHYQSGLDPAWSRSSAGLVLQGLTIQDAIEDGAGEYDMLAGGEWYKKRLATGRREARTLVITRAWHPMRALAAAAVGARRIGRRIRR